jgi:6-phosphogluconate dehydrogenase-like protein
VARCAWDSWAWARWAGFEVSAWNRTAGRAGELGNLGVALAESAAAVAAASEIVVTIVSDTPDLVNRLASNEDHGVLRKRVSDYDGCLNAPRDLRPDYRAPRDTVHEALPSPVAGRPDLAPPERPVVRDRHRTHPGRGKLPRTVTGTGEDQAAAPSRSISSDRRGSTSTARS